MGFGEFSAEVVHREETKAGPRPTHLSPHLQSLLSGAQLSARRTIAGFILLADTTFAFGAKLSSWAPGRGLARSTAYRAAHRAVRRSAPGNNAATPCNTRKASARRCWSSCWPMAPWLRTLGPG